MEISDEDDVIGNCANDDGDNHDGGMSHAKNGYYWQTKDVQHDEDDDVIPKCIGDMSQPNNGYWQTIDTQHNKTMVEIQKEDRLIYEIVLDVSTSFSVATGYCAAAQLIPGVKLRNKFRFVYEKSNIFIDSNDWYYFVSLLEQMWRNYKEQDEGTERPHDVCFSYYTLQCSECLGMKAVSVNNCFTTLYLTECTIENILKHRDMISERLQILIVENFGSKYDDFIRNTLNVVELQCGDHQRLEASVILNIIKLMCKNTESTFRYCLSECLHLNPEKVIADLEQIRYFQYPNSTIQL